MPPIDEPLEELPGVAPDGLSEAPPVAPPDVPPIDEAPDELPEVPPDVLPDVPPEVPLGVVPDVPPLGGAPVALPEVPPDVPLGGGVVALGVLPDSEGGVAGEDLLVDELVPP